MGEALTDEARVRQMVINLLSNAVKFTEEGSVTVRVETLGDERPTPGERTLIVSVIDTGKGIPGDQLSTLFYEYRQVKGQSDSEVQRGTGLGLSITRKFAELLGGSISVESELGKGSTFAVRIPSVYDADGRDTEGATIDS